MIKKKEKNYFECRLRQGSYGPCTTNIITVTHFCGVNSTTLSVVSESLNGNVVCPHSGIAA